MTNEPQREPGGDVDALADRDVLALMREIAPVVEQRRHYGLKIEDAEVYARAFLASDWLAADRARVRAETLTEAADAIVGYAWQPGDGIPVPVDQQALYVEAVGNAIDVSARVLRGMAEAGEDQ